MIEKYWYAEKFDTKQSNPHISNLLINGYTIVKNSLDPVLIDNFLLDYEKLKNLTLSQYNNKLDQEDLYNCMYRRLINIHLKLETALPLFTHNSSLEITD